MIDTLPGHDLCSMSAPMANEIEYVTRDMLRTELEVFEKKLDAKLDAKLELMLGAIVARIDAAVTELRTESRADMQATRDELRTEIRVAANAVEESMRAQIAAVDDKYRDMPAQVAELVPRVEHIERRLFTPEPPKRRRRAQRR